MSVTAIYCREGILKKGATDKLQSAEGIKSAVYE